MVIIGGLGLSNGAPISWAASHQAPQAQTVPPRPPTVLPSPTIGAATPSPTTSPVASDSNDNSRSDNIDDDRTVDQPESGSQHPGSENKATAKPVLNDGASLPAVERETTLPPAEADQIEPLGGDSEDWPVVKDGAALQMTLPKATPPASIVPAAQTASPTNSGSLLWVGLLSVGVIMVGIGIVLVYRR
ncbi:MAG: hypothetical protein KDI79_18055 [Anaerolineae bacterium]|nr:hypothetical protein [Anaerolineae bacterium]